MPIRIHHAALAALFLSGCAPLGQTPYVTPALALPHAWRHVPEQAAPDGASAAPSQAQWWRNFNDPALESLVAEALRRNGDLAAAAIAVQRARLQAGLTARNALPQVNASLGASGTRNLRGDPTASHSYSASAGASYEVDLWGKLSLQRDAAQWAAQATEQDRRSAALSLIGTTMGLYWKLGYLNQRLALSTQSIDHAERTLRLARVKYDAGTAAQLDVLLAEQALASQRADLAQLRHQQEENRNALSLLFDGPPGKVFAEPQQVADGPYPAIEAGLPASLLSRRPDLQAAELRLRESLAGTDIARMSFYPPLSLNGNVAGGGAALSSLLSNPAAALGAGLALPFLQWHEMKLSGKLARAEYERAVIAFRQVFYRALADVENALSMRQQLAEQAAYLDMALATAHKAERVAEVQYRAGSVPIKAWLDAQESRRAASIAAAANRLERLSACVALYQALGDDGAAPAGG